MTITAEPTFAVLKLSNYVKKRKISQEELAARMQVAGIDIDQRTISRIELEKRFLADFEMREIARILQISLDELAER